MLSYCLSNNGDDLHDTSQYHISVLYMLALRALSNYSVMS